MATIDRRAALARISQVIAAAVLANPFDSVAGAPEDQPHAAAASGTRVRKIATEEAFCIPEVAAAVRKIVRSGGSNLDLKLLKLVYDAPDATAERPEGTGTSTRDAAARTLLPRLLDLDDTRISEMDANGVDMHVLSLGVPGVQMFDADEAVALARLSNDRLSDAVRRHPTRFAGLACFAPQEPRAAVSEMERAINSLKLNGFLVNSHTQGVYLDDQRAWPILEAAQALRAPLYIHPRAPSDGMAGPFRDYRLEGAIWGYAVEAGTHALRLMLSGVLDRFPDLRIVLGHMGEALPFWLWRLDFMASPGSRAALRNQLKPSEYMQRNFAITTSGVEDPLVLRFCIDKIGVDRIMWAIDYPYQPTAPAVKFLQSASLTDQERAQIAFQNAERIFRIPPGGLAQRAR
jgi:predicted TIM-barrel fold metal-dependent hydrolase